jgi:hypothetical protein
MLLRSNDFRTRDIYIDYPFERAKFRWEKDTARVFRRFYGEQEAESSQSSAMFDEAIQAGKEISREEYFAD